MTEISELVAFARAAAQEEDRWRAVAQRLKEMGDPLGELLALYHDDDRPFVPSLGPLRWRAGPHPHEARLDELRRAWTAGHAPLELVWWSPDGLEVRAGKLDDLFSAVDELRRIPLPLRLRLRPGYREEDDVCAFDASFTRLAWMRCMRENRGTGSYGPSFEDDWHHFRWLTIFRVADRQPLFQLDEVAASWTDLEFRGEALYARSSIHADTRISAPLVRCRRCHLLFDPAANHPEACRTHAGNLRSLEIWGCCERLVQDPGCEVGSHEA
jgi:hypothetical protein